jgi:hypothetical protein
VPTSITKEELLRIIARAFAGVRFPGTGSLRQFELMDDWEIGGTQFDKARALDCTGAWKEVPEADIARFGHTCFAYADGETARYYLPAFMSYCLRRWAQPGATLMWVLFFLDPSKWPGTSKERADPQPRFGFYSDEQKSAVEAFLQFVADYAANRTDAEDAENALLEYWLNFRDWSLY